MSNAIDRKCMKQAFELIKIEINYHLLLSMVDKHFTYDIALFVANNKYYIINSNTVPLESNAFAGINQYFSGKFDELYLQLFDSFINVNGNRYHHMNTCTYNIFNANYNYNLSTIIYY